MKPSGLDRQSWTLFFSVAALLLSLLAFHRAGAWNAYASQENGDAWKSERQYPPLVFNSTAWLDCSISSTANGRQAMNTIAGQGFTFDAVMLPLKTSELKQTGQTGMMYKFDSFPASAVKAHFNGLGDGMIVEMKSEVEVSVTRFSQPGGPGTAISFNANDIARDAAYVEFTGLFVRSRDQKHFPFRVLFGRVRDGKGVVIPADKSPDTELKSKTVTLGSALSPVTVTTALYEAEEDVAKLKMQ